MIRDRIPPILHLGHIFAAVFRTIFTFFLHISIIYTTFAAVLFTESYKTKMKKTLLEISLFLLNLALLGLFTGCQQNAPEETVTPVDTATVYNPDTTIQPEYTYNDVQVDPKNTLLRVL